MQVMGLVDIFRAKIVDISEESLTIEVTTVEHYLFFQYDHFVLCIRLVAAV